MLEKVEVLRKEGPVLIPSLGKKGINAEYPLWNGIFASEFFPPQVESAYYVLRLFVEVATPEAARAAETDLLLALDLLARSWPFAGGSFMVVDPHEFTTKPAFDPMLQKWNNVFWNAKVLKKSRFRTPATAKCLQNTSSHHSRRQQKLR
ncbi:MAG TPA: hypothetical protein VFB79_13245 [Candidatus Angelobacter sp.]|nr:hypothetical protein [Candidatus Angelobacter sp.]